MNASNIKHGLYAGAMQAVAALICWLLGLPGGWWVGCAFASAFFISREHAQRELQIVTPLRLTPAFLKPWTGFTGWKQKPPYKWDRHLDAGLPVVFTVSAALIVETVL